MIIIAPAKTRSTVTLLCRTVPCSTMPVQYCTHTGRNCRKNSKSVGLALLREPGMACFLMGFLSLRLFLLRLSESLDFFGITLSGNSSRSGNSYESEPEIPTLAYPVRVPGRNVNPDRAGMDRYRYPGIAEHKYLIRVNNVRVQFIKRRGSGRCDFWH